MNNNADFFNWDDEITSNGSDFVTLMPGTYKGTITNVTKGRWNKKGEMIGCPYAEVSISIPDDGNGNSAVIKENLFLARKMEFKIASFLMALGLKKKDEPIRASQIEKAKDKKIKVTLVCQVKTSTGEYRNLTPQEAAEALEAGETVFNSVKRYEPSDEQPKDEQLTQDGSFNFKSFGYGN